MASGAEICAFAVYAGDAHRLTIFEVRHDLAMQARIRAAWDGFWPDYLAGRAPGEDYVSLLERSIAMAGGARPLTPSFGWGSRGIDLDYLPDGPGGFNWKVTRRSP